MQMNTKNNLAGLEKYSRQLLSSKDATHGLGRALRNLVREIALFKNHTGAKHSHTQRRFPRVQIGGGTHYLRGFLNIDINNPADLIYDVREGIPLPNSSVQFLFCEHFLEHIDYPASVKKMIKEAHRILIHGGKIVIGVPDTALLIGAYAKKDDKKLKEYTKKWYGKRGILKHFNTAIDVVNYHMRDMDDSEKYAHHFWGYDQEKLESLLKRAGFHHIQIWKFNSAIANPKRKFGSIYIEAKK